MIVQTVRGQLCEQHLLSLEFDMVPPPYPLWSFRPSALHESNYYGNVPSKQELMQHYMQDNVRAWREGVRIPPHSNDYSSQLLLRVAQWNIYAFSHETPSPNHSHDEHNNTFAGILTTLLESDADVIILNEYHWGGKRDHHTELEQELAKRGYQTHIATVFAPTMVATKLNVDHVQEVLLDTERSAMMLRVIVTSSADSDKDEMVWIVGTHLNDFNGITRNEEAKVLLEHVDVLANATERVIIAGDFNQQRQQDYQPDEWQHICKNFAKRGAPRHDGVSTLLLTAGFSSMIDQTPP